jgi:hypothetical protein
MTFQGPRPFTSETLRAALAINSPKLVGEVYEIVQRRIAYESGRQQRLDSKATSLLTVSGISLAFTFTAAILCGDLFHPAGVYNHLLVMFGFAWLCGLAASAFAVSALFVTRGYAVPRNEVIFNSELLAEADAIEPDSERD